VDKTELKGLFQFKLDWTNFPQNVSDKPGIFQTLEEQLGLRMEARKLPIETLVIDHLEKPSANYTQKRASAGGSRAGPSVSFGFVLTRAGR